MYKRQIERRSVGIGIGKRNVFHNDGTAFPAAFTFLCNTAAVRSSSDLAIVGQMCIRDRISSGRIVPANFSQSRSMEVKNSLPSGAVYTPENIYRKPATEFVARFIGFEECV